MKYLHLRFEGAGLKHADCKKQEEGKVGHCSLSSPENYNWSCPIGLDQISNMLHVMFGLPPKATYRETIFKRNKDIYELAKGAYIKYDNYCENDIKNAKSAYNLEFFQTRKPFYNSEFLIKTKIGDNTVSGYYTWDYFERRFKGKNELLEDIMNFFNEVIGVDDVKKYHFPEFILEFHKHLNEKKVQSFFNDVIYYGSEYFGVNKPLNIQLIRLLKNNIKEITGSNCSYNQPTPLLYSKGTGRKLTLNGEIIVPIENEEYVKFLEEWGTLPTLLDGGLVTVISIKKPPRPDFEDYFMRISEAEKWHK